MFQVIPVKEFVGRRGMPKYIFIVYDGECLQYRHLHLLQRKDRFGNTIIRLDKNQHKQQQEQQGKQVIRPPATLLCFLVHHSALVSIINDIFGFKKELWWRTTSNTIVL